MFFSVSVLLLASVERFGVFRMRDFFGIGATIRIGREMLCLPYAGFKNPAYGRHRISRPMLKEAPAQKKTYRDFSSSSGDLVKRGWAAVHSTAEPRSTFYPLNYTALLSYAVHFTEKF